MRTCVRCNKRPMINEEWICKECLNSLAIVYKIPKKQDPLEDANIKMLIQCYKLYAKGE